jgi:hypothetical protein
MPGALSHANAVLPIPHRRCALASGVDHRSAGSGNGKPSNCIPPVARLAPHWRESVSGSNAAPLGKHWGTELRRRHARDLISIAERPHVRLRYVWALDVLQIICKKILSTWSTQDPPPKSVFLGFPLHCREYGGVVQSKASAKWEQAVSGYVFKLAELVGRPSPPLRYPTRRSCSSADVPIVTICAP